VPGKKGKVWATATEDMDALTFATPILLRRLTMPESRKLAVLEIHVDKVLGKDGLDLTLDEFVDLCILCGCDYCDSIKGIGPKTALRLIKEHKTIENVIASLDRDKFPIPEMLATRLDEVRALFKTPEVTPAEQLDLTARAPDREGLVEFLVKEMNFNTDRVQRVVDKLFKARSSGSQMRLDSFFTVTSSEGSAGAFKKKPQDQKKDARGVKRQKR
jgi:flap endonuclease-1